MARQSLDPNPLSALLLQRRIATLDEMKEALATSSTMTVFRQLKEQGYLTSYSHRGQYYTLVEIPDFDEQGLWSCRSVWFSQQGKLGATCQHWVEHSETGWTARELEQRLQAEVKRPLLQLVRQKRIEREKIGGVYVYLAREQGQQRRQRLLRQDRSCAASSGAGLPSEPLSQELQAAIILFFSLLDEQQRRLYAGLEAQKLGHGGDRQIAELLGLDVHTVARGRRELLGAEVERGCVRPPGAGRPAVEKKHRKSSPTSPR